MDDKDKKDKVTEDMAPPAAAELRNETSRQGDSATGPAKRSAVATLRRLSAVLGLGLVVVAWIVFFFNPLVSVALAVSGLVLSIFGIGIGRGCLRDISITALVAATVLVLVYAVFYWGVAYAVDNL